MIKKLFKSRKFIITLSIVCALVIIFVVRHAINKTNVFYTPDYSYTKITQNDSYDKIFKYTGLSPAATRQLIKNGDFETVEELNTLYFSKPVHKLNYIAYPVTAEEKNLSRLTPLAPLKDGDILVTFNTHTLDWRHGHLALVIDADTNLILEHMAIGQTSCYGDAGIWGGYPSFAILRYPDEAKAKEASEYANEKLLNIPYSIFAGMVTKDKSKEETIDSSHCSHIVWQAYKAVGIDLDCNGGVLVTPRDVAMSEKLEVVQIYGLNPDDYKSRLAR